MQVAEVPEQENAAVARDDPFARRVADRDGNVSSMFFPKERPAGTPNLATVYKYFPINTDEQLNDFIRDCYSRCPFYHFRNGRMARLRKLVNVLTRVNLVKKREELNIGEDSPIFKIAVAFILKMMNTSPGNFANYQVEFGWNRFFRVYQMTVRYYGEIEEWELSDWHGWSTQDDEMIEL